MSISTALTRTEFLDELREFLIARGEPTRVIDWVDELKRLCESVDADEEFFGI